MQIDYLCEDSHLGTAGAMSLLKPRPDIPLVVTNGDVLTDISYGEMLDYHCRYEASATMAVRMCTSGNTPLKLFILRVLI